MSLNNFFLFIVISLYSCFTNAQESRIHFSKLVKLDSILFIENLSTDAKSNKLITKVINDTIYLNYYQREINKDTFFLIKINLFNKNISTQFYLIPWLKYALIDERQVIQDFDVNENGIIILVDNKLIYYSYNDKNVTKIDLEIYSDYNKIKLIKDKVILSKSNNYKYQKKKAEIVIMDLKSQKIINLLRPQIINYELTHFPVKPISISNNKIIISQNYDYSFSIYDFNLKCLQSISNFKPLENKFDSIKLKKMYDKGTNVFFEYVMEKYLNTGLLQTCIWIDSSKFLVVYNDGKNKNEDVNLFDLWTLDSITGKYYFTRKTYESNYSQYHNTLLSDSNFIINKNNYFEYLLESPHHWYEDYFVTIRTGAKVYPIGYNLKQLFNKRNDYLTKFKPAILVTILKMNKNE